MAFEEEHDDYTFEHLTIRTISFSFSSNIIPICAATDSYPENIYVSRGNYDHLYVSIISESGNIVKEFKRKGLLWTPLGIAIHQDNLYITLLENPFLVQSSR